MEYAECGSLYNRKSCVLERLHSCKLGLFLVINEFSFHSMALASLGSDF